MARLKMYEQQTTPGQVRASPVDMGAGVAQAMGQAGEAVLGYGDLLMRREEKLAAIKAEAELPQILMKDLEGVRSKGDIASEKTVQEYEQLANQRVEELLKTAGGRTGAQNELRGQLMGMVGQSIRNVRGEQIKEQYRQGAQAVDGLVSTYAAQATYASSPENMTSILTMIDKDIDRKVGDVFDQNVVAQMRQGAKSKLIQTTVTGLQNRGDWQGAKALLAMPEVKGMLEPDASMRLNLSVAVAEGKSNQETAKLKRNAGIWGRVTGKTFTDAEAATLPDFDGMGALGDKIAVATMMKGAPLEQREIDALTEAKGTGNRTARLAELTIAVNGNTATPADKIEFQSLATTIHGGQWVTNAQGVQVWQADPETPLAVRQALSMVGGIDQTGRSVSGAPMASPQGQPVSRGRPGEVVQFIDHETNQFVTTTRGPDGTFSTARDPGSSVTPFGDQPRAPDTGRRTGVFDMLGSTAGPLNKLSGLAGDVVPLVGGSITPDAQRNLQYQPQVRGLINDLKSAFMSGDGKPLSAEYTDISSEIEKLEQVVTNPVAAQNRAYGIDIRLEQLVKKLEKDAGDVNLAKADSNRARAMLSTIGDIRERLDVRRPKDVNELRQMYLNGRIEVGDVFYNVDGSRKIFNQAAYDMLFKKAKK